MGCGNCGTSTKDGDGKPSGCGSNGNCATGGCNKLNSYNWLQNMVLPTDYKPFDIVEIQFKGSRKEYYRNIDDLDLFNGDPIVVESDFGHDLGHISLSGELVRLQLKKRGIREDGDEIRKIYRRASQNDIDKYEQFKYKEPETLERARTIAMSLRLRMKISDIEFQGDGRKVIFYYTAEERVDFRELIRRYASEFKTRIEMRQVSYREEASRLGGIGSCGRDLCCSTWLTDYKLVSMSAAKTQNLSINMLKLSGQCGRLKCCLNYELESYIDALSEFPSTDRLQLRTQQGTAYLQKTDILKRMLWFSYDRTSEWTAINLDRVNEIMELNKKDEKPESLIDLSFANETIELLEPAADLISDQSLTRLDKKDQGKRRNKNRNKRNRNPRSQHSGNSQARSNDQSSNKSSDNRSDKGSDKDRNPRNKNRNRSRNNPKPQGENKAANPQATGEQKKKRPFRTRKKNTRAEGGPSPKKD